MNMQLVNRLIRQILLSISASEHKKTLSLGLFFVGVSLFNHFYVIPNQIFVPQQASFPGLSPAFYPKILTILLGFLGIVLAVQSLRSSYMKEERSEQVIGITAFSRYISVIALSALYVYFIDLAGWLSTTIVILFVLMRLYGSKRWFLIFTLSIIVPLILFLFFEKIALVRLPRGFLFE